MPGAFGRTSQILSPASSLIGSRVFSVIDNVINSNRAERRGFFLSACKGHRAIDRKWNESKQATAINRLILTSIKFFDHTGR